MVMPCGFPVLFASKKANQTENRPKSEKKNAKMNKSISAKIHPFRLYQPKSQQRNKALDLFAHPAY
jgi:hypothetical protein